MDIKIGEKISEQLGVRLQDILTQKEIKAIASKHGANENTLFEIVKRRRPVSKKEGKWPPQSAAIIECLRVAIVKCDGRITKYQTVKTELLSYERN